MSESSAKSSMKKGFKAPILNTIKPEGKENNIEQKEFSQKLKKEKKKNEEKNMSAENIKTEESEKSNAVPKEKKKTKALQERKESVENESQPKVKKPKKPEVSLSDSQYEEIFKAVLRDCSSQHNTPIEELLEAVASSSQKSSVKGFGKEPLTEPEGSAKTCVSLKDQPLILPELSPWGSHISKQNSQASSILKELQASQASSLLSPEPTSSSEDTDGDGDVVLSQQSVRHPSQRSDTRRKADKRARLEELQEQRNVGLWVFCDRMTCQKQRYLPHVTDPQDLPDIWYCHMNPDTRYNSCLCEEQRPTAEEEEDMIDNQFTCGSVVWARVTGFPWWPAMVDDDPDLECYYWLDEGDFRTVTFYHVVFFDKNEVTRAWIPVKKVVPFKKNMNSFKQRVVRGIDFSDRLRVAREQAECAAAMTVAQRLRQYSFIARYKGPILDDPEQIEMTKKKYKLKCSIGRKEAVKRGRKRHASANEKKPMPFENTVKNSAGKQRKLSMEKFVKNPPVKNVDNGSNTDTELAEAKEKSLSEKGETKSEVQLDTETNISLETHGNEDENLSEKPNLDSEGLAEAPKKDDDKASETPSGILFDTKTNSVGESQVPVESKPPSICGSNVSHKSKVSSKHSRILGALNESVGSIVEPSQLPGRLRAEDEDSTNNKLSQSTIADFLAAESQDAVVPEADFSQHSEPFEE